MENVLQIRHNVISVLNISRFEGVKGGVNDGCKDVYFVRAIGTNATYIDDVVKVDEALLKQMNEGKGFYCRINLLPKTLNADDVSYYVQSYSDWIGSGKTEIHTKTTRNNGQLTYVLARACAKVEEIYRIRNAQLSDSMMKNFIVKLMFWVDDLFCKKKFGNIDFIWDEKKSIKIVAANVEKLQEYLFYYMLTLIGCDVMLLQGSKDISNDDEALNISAKFVVGELAAVFLPEYGWHDTRASKETPAPVNDSGSPNVQGAAPDFVTVNQTVSNPPRLVIPPRNRVSKVASTSSNNTSVQTADSANLVRTRNQVNIMGSDVNEKSFEELALLASSIVMIAIHNDKGEVIGSGSGIMVGREGYILTNNHVTAGGRSYSVRIEDDNNVYETDEMIKYNQFLDLAIIRINRRLDPIKVYNGTKKLVRGQKVVAIGSPLGLFNSVSNGIISGFRQIDMVDMIQFTAPTSHGSSGGAVLNMQGEVIGISTAGYSAGQNINLAVGYEAINQFIKGFI